MYHKNHTLVLGWTILKGWRETFSLKFADTCVEAKDQFTVNKCEHEVKVFSTLVTI